MQKEVNNSFYFGKNTAISTLETKSVNKVYLKKGGENNKLFIDLAQQHNTPYVLVTKDKLDLMTGYKTHQGVVVEVAAKDYLPLEDMIIKLAGEKSPLVVILDEVTDVNNMGSILRVSDCFGIDGVIIGKKRSVQLNETVAKISTGAINYVDVVRETNIKNSINRLKQAGYWICYLDMNGEDQIQDFDFNQKLAVVVGGEDKGVTASLKKHCDFGIKINMSGQINSLNVATAVTVLAYQKSIKR